MRPQIDQRKGKLKNVSLTRPKDAFGMVLGDFWVTSGVSLGHFRGRNLIMASVVLIKQTQKDLLSDFSLFELLRHFKALSCHLGGTFGASFSGHKNVMYIIICCMQGM